MAHDSIVSALSWRSRGRQWKKVAQHLWGGVFFQGPILPLLRPFVLAVALFQGCLGPGWSGLDGGFSESGEALGEQEESDHEVISNPVLSCPSPSSFRLSLSSQWSSP